MNDKLIFQEDPRFNPLWSSFTESSCNVSRRYLERLLRYQKVYNENRLQKDLSFVIQENGRPMAICPLFMEKNAEKTQFSSGHGYQLAPLTHSDLNSKNKSRLEKECFEIVDSLAMEHKVSKTMFMGDYFDQSEYNFLTQYGYLDSSIATCVIDLSKPIESLWTDQRKSYRPLINKSKKRYELTFMSRENPDKETFKIYSELHHKAAGKITRSPETFAIQFEMIENDQAMLLGLKSEGAYVAFSFFSHSNGGAYYGSAADDPDFKTDVPLSHLILWSSIEYYKKRNYRYIELGWQQFGPQFFDLPNEKDIQLSFFKRGFGGKTVPLYRGVKYYDKSLMKSELEKNLNQLMERY